MAPGTPSAGNLLMLLGTAVALLGALVWGLERLGIRLGDLPLDLHFKGENGEIHFPLGTSILVSVLLTLAANWLLRR